MSHNICLEKFLGDLNARPYKSEMSHSLTSCHRPFTCTSTHVAPNFESLYKAKLDKRGHVPGSGEPKTI